MDNLLIILTAAWPVILALAAAFYYRKSGVTKLQVLMSGSTLVTAPGRYMASRGRTVFWSLLVFWLFWGLWLAAK